MTTYNVAYEQAGDGSWSASSPDVPGCYSVGDTVDEAEAGMREALALHLEELRRRGEPLPERRSAVGTVTA
jgi:predicted RNase H-like HicB family nuclease